MKMKMSLQAGIAEADAVILRMPLHSLADNDADAQVISLPISFSFVFSWSYSSDCKVSTETQVMTLVTASVLPDALICFPPGSMSLSPACLIQLVQAHCNGH